MLFLAYSSGVFWLGVAASLLPIATVCAQQLGVQEIRSDVYPARVFRCFHSPTSSDGYAQFSIQVGQFVANNLQPYSGYGRTAAG